MLIKIIKIPAGEAPEMVRQQWLGVVMEAIPTPTWTVETHVLSEKPLGNRKGYWVDHHHALVRLEQSSPGAAAWFRDHVDPMDALTFGPDEAVVVENER